MAKLSLIKTLTTVSVVSLVLLAANAYAATAKGKLVAASPRDYKVVAVHKAGSISVANISSSGKFAINVKKGSTLHLIDRSGRYRGPLVTAKGSRAYATMTGIGGSIGSFTLKTGFAVGKYNLTTIPFFAAKPRLPFSSASGPRGANKFGFVQVQATQLSAKTADFSASAVQEGQDSDLDGLPDLLDIDDDGDLKLDIVDEVPHATTTFQGETFSTLRLDLVDSLNINSGGISDTLIDQLISEHLILRIGVRNNGSKTMSSVNVDCGSLSYCAKQTGTATIRMDNGPLPENALWTGHDPDSDGFPNLQIVQEPIQATIGIRPRATREQLRTGDTILLQVKNSDNSKATVPAVIPFVFSTGPALKEFSSGGSTTTISYPVTAGEPGTSGLNPFVLNSGSVTLTFWKPQRKNIDGAENEGYYDMGGLAYGVSLAVNGGVYSCNADEYSSPSETLSKISGPTFSTSILRDSALDMPASPSNTLSFTVDIASCLARQGVTALGVDGAIVTLALEANTDAQDTSSQFIIFQLP